jgi:hypothetical protein
VRFAIIDRMNKGGDYSWITVKTKSRNENKRLLPKKE